MKMEPKKMIELTVGIVVGLVVFSAILMPVVNNATVTEKTFSNEGYYNMEQLGEDASYKLFWDHAAPNQVTINDTDVIPLNATPYQALTILGSNEFSMRFLNEPTNPRIQLYGGNNWSFTSASVNSAVDITAVLEDGTLTITTNAETPYSESHDVPTDLYGVYKGGSFVMKKTNDTAYVLGDTSVIVLCGLTIGNGLEATVYADGTVNDGLTYTLIRPTQQADTAVFDNEVITASDVPGYIGLKALEKVQFSITLTGGTVESTYTYFLVPAKVTAELSQHLDGDEIQLIKTIPILIIAGLIVGIAAVVVSRRE